ncbi:MAG: dihydropyrimidinase [Anaerolineaceae bacterium]|jgi:dihydropyrimidinase|nr:dihydropyrimidinase [Anaerolineaceae bacterium]
MTKTIIHGGKIVTSQAVTVADILIENGVITDIQPGLEFAGSNQINAQGKLVLPGGVDVHTHMPWPTGSFISTDTLASGSRAAAFGGVTSIIDFAIPNENESLQSALDRKLAEATIEAWVDYSFHINIRGEIHRNLGEIPELVQAGFPSYKVFMAYEGFRLPDADLLQVLKTVQEAGGMVNVHAENGPLADYLTTELIRQGKRSLAFFPQARPAICEEEAVSRILTYQKQTGVRLHIHHVSTAAAVDLIRSARAAGQPLTAETCPQYLVFCDEDYCSDPQLAAALVCAPAVKSKHDQAALWEGLIDGTLSAVATDHCPYSKEQKFSGGDNFSLVPGGMAGVETRLPLLFDYGVNTGRLSLSQFAFVWAEGPARSFGLFPRKGTIAIGSDADLVIFDPNEQWKLKAADLHMNTDYLSYEGFSVTGKPKMTILRGEVIVQDNHLGSDRSRGALIPRSLQAQFKS